MARRSSLLIQGTVADAFRRSALQLGLHPAEPIGVNDATQIADIATRRMTPDNRRRWTRIFLQGFIHNNTATIQDGLTLIAAQERGDAERLNRSESD